MELRHLRYFLALAEEGHFGRAAARLHIVQPALSMQIRALEDELGGPLFVRTSRRVELTEAGRLLRVEAQRALDQAAHAKLAVQRTLRGELGRVRVGFAGNAVFSGKLMGDLRAFHAAYPDAELTVAEMSPRLQAEALLQGRLDVGYAPGLADGLDPGLLAEPVGRWRWGVAMHEAHPLAARKRLRARQLAGEPLVLYALHGADEAQRAGLAALLGAEPRVAHRAESTLGVLALAAAGLGIAMLPAPVMQVAIPGLVYRRIDEPGLAVDLMLLSLPGETSGAVQAFLAIARAGRASAE